MRLHIVALAVFLLDQVTKVIVVHAMNLREVGSIDVLPPLLNFRMGWNRGINFGLFSGGDEVMRWILVAIALGIVAWVWWWMRSEDHGPRAEVAAGLLIGGALGNVVDRLLYGAVADFLNMSCCGIENPYTFNVADIAIFAGAVGLIFFTGGDRDKGRDAAKDKKA
ncbi:signal peptidase II [Palleronia sp. KMU-117]|uniref:signal peptidase II n=1 Tax=Palleronia sp. KMU-117 TaxID=3434108 RepID=UPI003D724E26